MSTYQSSERPNRNAVIYAIAGLVILLAVGGVLALLFLSGGSEQSGQGNNSLIHPTLPATPGPSTVPTTGSSVVVSDGCGDVASPRPSTFQLQCSGPGASLSNLSWTSWDAQSGVGTGTYSGPAPQGSNLTNTSVTVTMYQPVAGANGPEFSTIAITPANGPDVIWTQSSPDGPWAPSSSARGPMPAGGKLCPGTILGKYQFGTIGSNTSCGFVRAVYRAWESSGNQSPVTATSPTTHETYRNIMCTTDSTQSWETCVGGRNNTARMFFALP